MPTTRDNRCVRRRRVCRTRQPERQRWRRPFRVALGARTGGVDNQPLLAHPMEIGAVDVGPIDGFGSRPARFIENLDSRIVAASDEPVLLRLSRPRSPKLSSMRCSRWWPTQSPCELRVLIDQTFDLSFWRREPESARAGAYSRDSEQMAGCDHALTTLKTFLMRYRTPGESGSVTTASWVGSICTSTHHAPPVLRRARSLSGDTTGIGHGRIGGQNLLDDDPVLPVVAEVVDVADHRA
jgi:hypothetical protein